VTKKLEMIMALRGFFSNERKKAKEVEKRFF
jgi:hypothetical protein